jgi:hypothetical protein
MRLSALPPATETGRLDRRRHTGAPRRYLEQGAGGQ